MGWRYYEPSRPRKAKGGIKSQSRRGSFAQSWWAKRWVDVLESFNLGARLTRGRSYARQGQVLSVEIEKGCVTAKVQGSRAKPYSISMKVKQLSEQEWTKVVEVLSAQAVFAASLLSGEMPQEVESAFEQAGVSLFPRKRGDLVTDCSCPDWSNPCKHIAAVYYLLGEEFDRDPFLIFKLRGLSRDELMERLHAADEDRSSEEQEAVPEPLPVDASDFWAGRGLPEDVFGEVRLPPVSAALPKRLGKFPLWRGEEQLHQAIEQVYITASREGLDLFIDSGTRDG